MLCLMVIRVREGRIHSHQGHLEGYVSHDVKKTSMKYEEQAHQDCIRERVPLVIDGLVYREDTPRRLFIITDAANLYWGGGEGRLGASCQYYDQFHSSKREP